MKITCDNRSLQVAASACVQVVKDAPDRPVMRFLRLSTDGDRLIVLGSDRETWVRQVVAGVTVRESGAALVPGRDFLRWLQASPAKPVTLTENPNHVLAECVGRQKFSKHPVGEYPEPDAARVTVATSTFAGQGDDGKPLYKTEFTEHDNTTVADVVVPTTSLLAAVNRVIYCANKRETERNYATTGVSFEVGDLRLTCAAADGRHMGVTTVETARPAADGKVHTAVVPRDVLLKLATVIGSESEVTVSVGDCGIVFRGDRSELGTRLLTGRFPDFRRLAATTSPDAANACRVPTAELLAALGQITSVAPPGPVNLSRVGNALSLWVPTNNEATVMNATGDAAASQASVPCDGGPDFGAAFHWPDVMNTLRVARTQGSEEVLFYPPQKARGWWLIRPTPGGWDYYPPVMASRTANGGDS